jgi:hypothetical protein
MMSIYINIRINYLYSYCTYKLDIMKIREVIQNSYPVRYAGIEIQNSISMFCTQGVSTYVKC